MEDNIIKINYDNIDVEDIMRQIRENIKKRNYSKEDIDKLTCELDTLNLHIDSDLDDLSQNVYFNNIRWNIQKAGQITSNKRFIGPLIVLIKRFVRKLSYWYVQFLFDQQIEFNASVTNSINAIEKYIKKLLSVNSKLIETLNNFEIENEKLSKEMKYLEDENNSFREIIKELKNENAELKGIVNHLKEENVELEGKIEHIENYYDNLKQKIENFIVVQKEKIEESKKLEYATAARIRIIERQIALNNNKEINDIHSDVTFQSNNSLDMDYFLFESKFRGSREEIKDRQRVYLEYFKGKRNVLDIGCGRGEFVELLIENGVGVSGIDINLDNVNYCIDRGLPVKHAEAIEYLRKCENSSLDGIFIAQVVEHLRPNELISLIRLAREKLQLGSYLVIETINPKSLIVFTESYYMDPSHIKLIHPLTLEFIIETEGFSDINIKYLSPVSDEFKIPKLDYIENCKNIEDFNKAITKLNDLIYGYRDYAVIARR